MDAAGFKRKSPEKDNEEAKDEEEADESSAAQDVVSQTTDLPQWLRDVMADDDATALSKAMLEQQVQEADLEFFNEEALKEAGVAKAISRAKVLRRIRDHFK